MNSKDMSGIHKALVIDRLPSSNHTITTALHICAKSRLACDIRHTPSASTICLIKGRLGYCTRFWKIKVFLLLLLIFYHFLKPFWFSPIFRCSRVFFFFFFYFFLFKNLLKFGPEWNCNEVPYLSSDTVCSIKDEIKAYIEDSPQLTPNIY